MTRNTVAGRRLQTQLYEARGKALRQGRTDNAKQLSRELQNARRRNLGGRRIKNSIAKRMAKEARERRKNSSARQARYVGGGQFRTGHGGTLRAEANTNSAIGVGDVVQLETRRGSSNASYRTRPR